MIRRIFSFGVGLLVASSFTLSLKATFTRKGDFSWKG